MPVPIHLTCDAAIAAARAAIADRVAATAVADLEFHFGRWCPPGWRCPASPPDLGFVIVHLHGLAPDLLVQVSADENGTVSVASVGPVPSAEPTAVSSTGVGATASPTAATPPLATCSAAALELRGGRMGGGTGTAHADLFFTNVGSTPCSLSGRPTRVEFLTADGTPLTSPPLVVDVLAAAAPRR